MKCRGFFGRLFGALLAPLGLRQQQTEFISSESVGMPDPDPKARHRLRFAEDGCFILSGDIVIDTDEMAHSGLGTVYIHSDPKGYLGHGFKHRPLRLEIDDRRSQA